MMRKVVSRLLIGLLVLTGTAKAAVLAEDNAGNYTPATFTNGANAGVGFGAWELWNKPAELGDSTEGGADDINSTNGYAFRIMADGTNGWSNAARNFVSPLSAGNVLSFRFAYNWDGGNRGVDIYSVTGQFANVIDVSGGNTFKVNGTTVSTDWSPTSIVDVEITQQTNGILVHVVRTQQGFGVNLDYTTNILNDTAASRVSMYCGGYTAGQPQDNVNYAIFMNDLKVEGVEQDSLTFTQGTWDPSATGDYTFALSRGGAVGTNIILSSSNPSAATVPAAVNFEDGSNSVSFLVSVVSLTSGSTTILASNTLTGITAEYGIFPVVNVLSIGGPGTIALGDVVSYTLTRSGNVADGVSLSVSPPGALAIPATVSFAPAVDTLSFVVTGLVNGVATLSATNGDAAATPKQIAVGTEIAHDEANNYTPATFTNGANAGTGFGAWDLWNKPAELGDSTEGGADDINSANGYAFRIMGDGTNGWSNAARNFVNPLSAGDVLSFRFAYNWDGGNRGVDIYSVTGQFANVIDVSGGNTFKVNGTTVSTDWSPDSIVDVEITQETNGILVHVVRTQQGFGVNLDYTTNILNDTAASRVSMYCGGYTAGQPQDNVNYAIFMNDLRIVATGEESEPGEGPEIASITYNAGAGTFTTAVPVGYSVGKIEAAPLTLNGQQDWQWQELAGGVDYTVNLGVITISPSGADKIIRIYWVQD